jgi:hypothetical protein
MLQCEGNVVKAFEQRLTFVRIDAERVTLSAGLTDALRTQVRIESPGARGIDIINAEAPRPPRGLPVSPSRDVDVARYNEFAISVSAASGHDHVMALAL